MAWSSITGVTDSTSGICLILLKLPSLISNDFPIAAVIFISGSNDENIDLMVVSSPLKTERMTISAKVPTVTPAIEIPEMMLITFTDFFEIR